MSGLDRLRSLCSVCFQGSISPPVVIQSPKEILFSFLVQIWCLQQPFSLLFHGCPILLPTATSLAQGQSSFLPSLLGTLSAISCPSCIFKTSIHPLHSCWSEISRLRTKYIIPRYNLYRTLQGAWMVQWYNACFPCRRPGFVSWTMHLKKKQTHIQDAPCSHAAGSKCNSVLFLQLPSRNELQPTFRVNRTTRNLLISVSAVLS